jgi:asparagine synthase (glutamine-hydrolysing)
VHKIVFGFILLKTDLTNAIFDSVMESVADVSSPGIAFSGGVDSTLLAVVCKKLCLKPILLTIGFPNSQDIQYSKLISSKINVAHLVLEISHEDFLQTCRRILRTIQCKNTSHIENCVAFHYVGKLASTHGIKTVLTANGFDELFCGYDNFRSIFNQGDSSIDKAIGDRLVNEFELMKEISQTTRAFDIRIKQPFLSEKFISVAKKIPVNYKIIAPNDLLRKHILRKIALSLDLPGESVIRRKKAIQYSSLIHKNYKHTSSKAWLCS